MTMKKLPLINWCWMTLLCLAGSGLSAVAQTAVDPPDNWQLLDPANDSAYGTGVERAYKTLLKGKKAHTVIVAVIDSGIDTAHVDLQGKIWTNPGEIPGNGKDDDHNGYVDDIHGWNFLGGPDGRSVVKESSELAREYFRLENKFGGVTDSSDVKRRDRADYRYWLTLREKKTQDSIDNSVNFATVSQGIERFTALDMLLRSQIGKDTLRLADIKDFETDNDTLAVAREIALRVLENSGPHQSLEAFLAEGREYLDGLKAKMNPVRSDPDSVRRAIVGDDPDDIRDTHYGNNDISGGFGRHGTHVAGIIAAVRNNGIGIDGIADHVQIMSVRAVPDGDERDKDVALAIRYAVDNGAKIINMSFGKGYSPHKDWVDEAVKYAAKHDVLLIHAAGNDGTNNGSIPNFPNPIFAKSGEQAENYLTVGASTHDNDEGHLAATFSNYGKKEVDLFAPGVNIYSTVPGNQYESLSGTSMAAPVVTGVAALVLQYYPTLSARQLAMVLRQSVTRLDSVEVILPGGNSRVPFGSLSRSGGIVDAYQALQMADTLKGERKVGKQELQMFDPR